MKLDSNLISFVCILLIILIVVIYLGFKEEEEVLNNVLIDPIVKDNTLIMENFQEQNDTNDNDTNDNDTNDNDTNDNNNNSELQDLLNDNMTTSRIRRTINAMNAHLNEPQTCDNDLVRRSELNPGDMCVVDKAIDRDKYISKSDLPPRPPEIDMNKYVLKSSIPPEKVCPPEKEIDYSKYVLKSSIPPPQKCPACICPKVKVSAGLCQKCPPPPKCPAPEPCPPPPDCPAPRPCPAQKEKLICPRPAPLVCPQPPPINIPEARVNPNVSQVKYIKVPTVITKTKTLDHNGNVVNEEIHTSGEVPPVRNPIPSSTMAAITQQAIQSLETTSASNIHSEEEEVLQQQQQESSDNNRLSYKCNMENDLNYEHKKLMGFSQSL